jgi:UDP-2,3-diacylglucosamine pyrophosphatase LpxH
MDKRNLDIVVLSDTHLGTYGCHAKELLQYLISIDPKHLVLNGDIIDVWQFRKNYFPSTHMQVIKELIGMMSRGTKVYYVTGNHDETFRRYSGLCLGNFMLDDKLVFDIDGCKTWIFHGDVFDATTKGSAKLIAKLGGKGYDLLILFNRAVNGLLAFFGKEKMSLSKKVKATVKKAVQWIGNFELTAAELAIEHGYTHVICGHIHQPQIRTIVTAKGAVTYMNSGDWIENLTSLEYVDGGWRLHQYHPATLLEKTKQPVVPTMHIPCPNVIPEEVALFIQSVNLAI